MDFTKEQQKIIDATEDFIVVNSAAAAGKTETLTEKVRQVLRAGAISPSKIVVFTFTNNAAEVLRQRLGADFKDGIFVGTIHSYVNSLLTAKGIDTSSIIIEEKFDDLFNLISDNLYCINEVDYLFLDEAQDSTDMQFKVILDYIKPKKWLFIGDWRQSIYGFRGSRPDILLDLAKRPDVKTYNLTKNFRNSKAILNFAKRLINPAGLDYMDTSIPARDNIGIVYDIKYDLNELIRGLRQSKDEYRDWFILARTNAQVDEITERMEELKLPYCTFKRNELTPDQLKEKMEENSVKVLTIHAAKGLERKNVIVVGARLYNTEEKCLSYVAATRARDRLIWTSMPKKNQREKRMYEW